MNNRESLYMSCLERNTHVFSQDPTVHRYNPFVTPAWPATR
jgi:hypothetical protein